MNSYDLSNVQVGDQLGINSLAYVGVGTVTKVMKTQVCIGDRHFMRKGGKEIGRSHTHAYVITPDRAAEIQVVNRRRNLIQQIMSGTNTQYRLEKLSIETLEQIVKLLELP